jgi:hypothetical protein
MAWTKRHLKKVPPGWIASVGDEVEIRKVKSNPNILVRYLSEVIEMHPDEAAEYISARGEEWVPRMWRPQPDDLVAYDDESLRLAHRLALKNHEIFRRDAAVYDKVPNGNECYENAHVAAERWNTIATMMAKEIESR